MPPEGATEVPVEITFCKKSPISCMGRSECKRNSPHVPENVGKRAVRTVCSRCGQGPTMGTVFSSHRGEERVALACVTDREGGRRR